MKKYMTIRRHPRDKYFVNHTMDLVDNAESEIHIVTGEFSIYYFPGVRESFREAINRGVSVKAYLGRCDVDTINKAVIAGMEVYQGDRLPPEGDHFLVVDRKHVLISKKHDPYNYGRHGPLYPNNKKIAEEKINLFNSLKSGIPQLKRTIDYRPRAEKFVEKLFA